MIKQSGFAPIIILFFIFFALFYTQVIEADIATPGIAQQGGSIYSTGTNISMEEENVVIIYDTDGASKYIKDRKVNVEAKFIMKNNGSKDENIKVYFPLDNSFFFKGTVLLPKNIENFLVNGKLLPKEDITSVDYGGKPLKGYMWDESFSVGQRKGITINYTSIVNDLSPDIYSKINEVSYVIGTGSTWSGLIGKGTITFVLPIVLHDYSFPQTEPLKGSGPITKTILKPVINGNQIIYTFENYKPSPYEIIDVKTYDLNLLKTIEQQKANFKDDYQSNFDLGNSFKTLSIGPHCVYCSTPATEIAKSYYTMALNKTSSKAQVLDVLLSYFEPQLPNTDEKSNKQIFEDTITFKNCGELTETECKFHVYGIYRDGVFLDVDVDSRSGDNRPFMLAAADKMRSYDPFLADAMTAFVNNYDSTKKLFKQSQENEQKTSTKESQDTSSLVVSSFSKMANVMLLIIFLTLVILGSIVYLTKVKSHTLKQIISRFKSHYESYSTSHQQDSESFKEKEKTNI